jgi:hypothetical protein
MATTTTIKQQSTKRGSKRNGGDGDGDGDEDGGGKSKGDSGRFTVEGMCLTSYIGTKGGILKYFMSE